MAKGVLVTGTDTDIGKTVVASAVLRGLAKSGLQVAGLKPIASGFDYDKKGRRTNADIESLNAASNLALDSQLINRYGFDPAIAPHIAAEQSGQVLDSRLIKEDIEQALDLVDFLVVEGAGGWHVPLSSDSGKDFAYLAAELKLPIVVVVGLRLGCLNHAMLTVNAIRQAGLPMAGWVANHISGEFAEARENMDFLKRHLPARLLFEMPHLRGGVSDYTPKICANDLLPD